MAGFIPVTMAVVLGLLGALLLVGGRALARSGSGSLTEEAAFWPAVVLVVPVAGAARDLENNLGSLLSQDYPDYQVIFATRDLDDPATPAIAALIPAYPRARLVVSGPAHGCGQKNHNLLAGLKAAGQSGEILVFCDATRQAPPNWLKGLVLPLVQGRDKVVSGYHHVLPREAGLPAWGRAVTVLFLYLTKGVSCLNQTWGGATAIRRQTFTDLQVHRLWAHTVVDDVSLAALLQEKGLRVGLAAGDSLATRITGETLTTWQDWLVRQWIYLKFCLPGSWLAVGVLFYLLAALTAFSGLTLLGAPWGLAPGSPWLAAAFLVALTGLGLYLRRLHPQPPSLAVWLSAFYAALFMAAWCHLLNWGSREIHWRGITYRVGRKGWVLGIK